MPHVGAMVFLELSLLAPDISIIRHGVAAEVDAFSQNFFHISES